uniref:Protein C10 n=1 Tax=Alexandrium catenella TaxID=2925 RepID=A0A7S1PUW3_ALECA
MELEPQRIALSKTQAVEINHLLAKAYSATDFQEKLRKAFEKAGNDERGQMNVRHQACFPVQAPIVKRFGFEPTRAGVWRCQLALETEDLQAIPEVRKGTVLLRWLSDPSRQKLGPAPAGYDRYGPRELRANEETGEGRLWVVTGGAAHGGIVVRQGKEMATKELIRRLGPGAVVEQADLEGGRLHYRKVEGDGPDYGWVSVSAAGKPLMRCLDEE